MVKTDWRIPDWTEQAAYPGPDPFEPGEMTIWAWEFLRRWPEYRAFWEQKIQPFVRREDGHIYIAGDWWQHKVALGTRFGVDVPSSPQSPAPAIFAAGYIRYVLNDGAERQIISLAKHEIAVVVDLCRPLNAQLDKVRRAAESEQNLRQQDGEFMIKMARGRADKYVSYLRILDARKAGATPKDIARLLFPKLDDGRARKRFDDNQRAARQLRDGGYRSLL